MIMRPVVINHLKCFDQNRPMKLRILAGRGGSNMGGIGGNFMPRFRLSSWPICCPIE